MNAGNTSGGGVALAGAWPRALQQPTSRGQNAAELKRVRFLRCSRLFAILCVCSQTATIKFSLREKQTFAESRQQTNLKHQKLAHPNQRQRATLAAVLLVFWRVGAS